MASGIHILVECQPIVLDIIQAILTTDYRVSSVSTAEEAHAILRSSHIDVTIIGSDLAGGLDADVAVVAQKVGAAVIVMTGDPQEHIGLVASGRRHLFKPFAANLLLATVEDALHAHNRPVTGAISMSARASSPEITALPP